MGVKYSVKFRLKSTTAMAAVFNYIAEKKAEIEDMQNTIFSFEGLRVKLDLIKVRRSQIRLII